MIKNLKKVLTFVFVVLVFVSFWYKGTVKQKSYESSEFLFDTVCKITAYGRNSKAAVDAAFESIKKINDLTDFYSEDSEVSKINSAKSGEITKISADTAKILKTALVVSEKSGGAFDPTVAPLSELWNFKEAKIPPGDELIKKALENVDYRLVVLDEKNLTVKKKKDGVKIDLGGAAKGYACDVAAAVLKEHGTSGTVDLGGNIACVGKSEKSSDGGWRVGLQKPFEPVGTYEKVISVFEKSVVTSGNYQRYFEYNNKIYHHILNTETGFPKEADYNAVTVVSSSSLEADCLSTACFVLGKEKGEALAKEFGAEVYFY